MFLGKRASSFILRIIGLRLLHYFVRYLVCR